MKFPPISAAVCATLLAIPLHLFGQAAPPAAAAPLGPRMTFATNEYHFGRIMGGEQVKYTFIVSNTGDQTLFISNVAPGCHCTTAGEWSKQIEPAQTGKIPLQFDSGSFRGDVTKTITVTSNDKLAPIQTLRLIGTIWKAIEINPQFANINVMPDAPSNSTTVVHLINQTDKPVTLSNPTCANDSFKAELKTIIPGKEFDVTITAVPPYTPASTTVSVHTSMTNMPVIYVTAIAIVPQALDIVPTQIMLMPPIAGWTTNVVNIKANWSKALALSDPESSDKRVNLELKEISPGRVFQLVAGFPPGFQLVPGGRIELKVKSNIAERPLIIVPVTQMPGPAMSQNPPAH